jgi:hypothetical protein
MPLHWQMAQHIDHIECGEEPDERGSYRGGGGAEGVVDHP